MSRLEKAARQAMEALESGPDVDPIVVGEFIDALRAALAQPEPFKPDWDRVNALEESLREHMAEIHRLKALAQPEQEPVASLMTHIESGDVKLVWNDEAFDLTLWRETPLYTAIPQRKPLRYVTYVCPVCAASLERQE